MNASPIVQTMDADNIVKLPTRQRAVKADSRFKVIEFENKSGTTSFRVDGYKRDGKRVRENFATLAAANCRQIELETEYLKGHAETGIQATKLTPEQLRLSEAAMIQLGDDWARLLDAVSHWKQHGKKQSAIESPELDAAVDEYLLWLDASTFRDATKRHWKTRMNVFKNSVGRTRVADVTPEFIETFLAGRKTSAVGKDTDRRAVSRFFSWCIENKWIATNPARKQTRTRKAETTPPAVLTVKQCKALLKASERQGLAPYVAVCLFGGIRPTETSRLTWAQVNLKDREIRLEGNQAKMRRPRVVAICDTLAAWLKAHKNKPFYPPNWRKKFDAVKAKAKITEWPADVLRHTAASHYFRQSGSYGRTAEQFGNSESIIKAHYQGRVTSDETKKFYALRPKKGGRK
jgi:integrase